MQQPTAGRVASAACMPCRTVKMKCTREPDSLRCNRCERKSLPCHYEAHRRGRKPGTKLRPKAERMKASTSYMEVSPPRESDTRTNSVTTTCSTISTEQDEPSVVHSSALDDEHPAAAFRSVKRQSPLNWASGSGSSVSSMASDGLAPFGLLRKSATTGNFSIANILNAEDENPVGDDSRRPNSSALENSQVDDIDDPVNKNLLSLSTAQSLFENFFEYMNPFICQFDPKLHTLQYIRSRSAFLFSALLSGASKVFLPTLYPALHGHAEALLRDILSSGQTSTEIVQGICLLTYWKEPSDSRAWLRVGYAIRACIEMGWHKLKPSNCDPGAYQRETEIQIRERRNKERAWLMLFVYDRSVSLQLGKPWMIQIDPLIRNSESWHQHPYAVPGCDHIMSAFVQLRILGSEILDLFWVDPETTNPQSISQNEALLKLFNGDLDRWEAKWYKTVEESSENVAHRFIIRFYGTHLRLLLHSFRLQLSILSGTISKQALWMCYTSSLDMLRLVNDRLSASCQMYYCQDSVHVMVAYAAVVMIKILLSLPGELPPESEGLILDLINQTSESFGRQCPATNTSCFYQTRFLANVVSQYRRTKGDTVNSSADAWLRQQHRQHQEHQPGTQRPSADWQSNTLPPLSQIHNKPKSLRSNSRCSDSPQPNGYNTPTSTPSLLSQMSPRNDLPQQREQYPFPVTNQSAAQHFHSPIPNPPAGGSNAPTAHPTYPATAPSQPNHLETFTAPDNQNNSLPLFTDNDVWTYLFANAGFNINSGAFLPNLAA
ncbi:hypothetical protein AJ80_05803 [Polytolypa hystricis UAMH7299]|uniref:Zn(2)-C6 fungal-type domain-containing protein n=1 Tax=Polytolypa hystricis (strain UAMH7299) TaxID=1447883 RepID=A0A2B7Y0R7_POLH7|nr:hypothetical protein AJ80_05803 [Polytolypa hystricis UAMH7299]